MKRTPNKLTYKDTVRLVDWFRSHKDDILRRRLTPDEVARQAGEALELKVTAHNVRGIAGRHAEAVVEFDWPRGFAGRRQAPPTAIILMYRMIEDIRGAMGHEIGTPELNNLWLALGAKLDSLSTPQIVETAGR